MQSKLTHNNDVRLVNRWRRIVRPDGTRILVRVSGSDVNNQNEKEQK